MQRNVVQRYAIQFCIKFDETVESVERENKFANRVITIFTRKYDSETRRQTIEWAQNLHRDQFRNRCNKLKIHWMVIFFYEHRGIIRKEFVPLDKTVD